MDLSPSGQWPGAMEEGRTKEVLTTLYLLLLIALVVLSDTLFTTFISSKPEGRKTVLGQHLTLLGDQGTYSPPNIYKCC